ncbi:4-amino-4-deoxychorismate synthase [Trichosporon asahii var. asahii CBS 8904]|uniref:aminodeoxychorismate synthase n=1 Tax=Trichosporon asahii var. asahii (strain CBS 8904) TaxID=1220162 RepID=K1VT72_TRIAC|nr:4-amino-4-deoxychorismate synthase [Trichosporon asahii var. asahii CBS 8904]
MVPPLPRTVIVDYYDSFPSPVAIAEIRATFQREVIPNTDCVILSPGPGRPDHPAAHPVPILGVCLGHQAIGVAFGGKTPKITHGHVVRVVPVTPPKGLFASPVMGSKPFEAVVYNSLCINPSTVPDELEVTAWSDPQNGSEPTIQGLMHKELPIWGVQYHPESISSTHGTELLHAFLDKVHEYHGQPPVFPRLERQLVAACTYRVASSAAPTRAASPAPSPTSPTKAEAPQYALEEESFGSLGQDRDTAEVYERMVRSDKNRIGEIWLDGKSCDLLLPLSGARHVCVGESYELNQTTSFLASLKDDPYPTYLRLRTFNPAYYSAFIHFPTLPTPKGKGLAVISSSPERFLQITGGEIEMRPIKGTAPRVRPGQCVCADGRGCDGKEPGSAACTTEGRRVDEQRGKELSEDLKERAENLMLIALESYGVHNLVTTVRGRLAPHIGPVEATKRCFPPGSMTGAPKLRTVQLLDGFEAGYPRGIYSGALGYFSLCGSSDLSVVIRTMVLEGEDLSIGAGGAITWLSDRAEEWKEVLTKVQSVVGPLDL